MELALTSRFNQTASLSPSEPTSATSGTWSFADDLPAHMDSNVIETTADPSQKRLSLRGILWNAMKQGIEKHGDDAHTFFE
ncbi:hypothetical protein HDU98_007128 [Podochytrium sp. JEL0797]|nr:hypothetical protein HDU98_007128 [Podochytrium sp. JEL0797]